MLQKRARAFGDRVFRARRRSRCCASPYSRTSDLLHAGFCWSCETLDGDISGTIRARKLIFTAFVGVIKLHLHTPSRRCSSKIDGVIAVFRFQLRAFGVLRVLKIESRYSQQLLSKVLGVDYKGLKLLGVIVFEKSRFFVTLSARRRRPLEIYHRKTNQARNVIST